MFFQSYESIRRAVREAIPGAIKDALGWHTIIDYRFEIVEKKIHDGFEAKLKHITDSFVSDLLDVQVPEEPEIIPKYIIKKIILKKTYMNQVRFNPVTGDYENREDKNPLVEAIPWSMDAEDLLKYGNTQRLI